ncbi:EXLDI protein [Actinoplanes utahensis]|uniref:EXLDI protein n=1 Tax=Actinoplanes utahensis TaxID=1869 RepID=A0A0A6X5D4_ACTUT|nr:EXLDI protein [Actinoplanes utahensis]KHD75297.1 hypothetical protein MB27_23850 [Actinoplanes utahensis]GIF30447.1 hypothetical protein Aut01nite_34330 [Actinoplanes utahensis]
MPNKTIYVSDDDLQLFARAQELSGGNLSATISTALRRYVEAMEGRREGFEEITVKVGPKPGRKVRFTGVLLGDWNRTTPKGSDERFRVYRSQKGRFVVHTQRSEEHFWSGDQREPGIRAMLQAYLGSAQTWGVLPGEATLDVVDTVEEFRELIPSDFYDAIASILDQPAVEDLDI